MKDPNRKRKRGVFRGEPIGYHETDGTCQPMTRLLILAAPAWFLATSATVAESQFKFQCNPRVERSGPVQSWQKTDYGNGPRYMIQVMGGRCRFAIREGYGF